MPAILSPSLDSTVPCGSYIESVKLLPISPNILDDAVVPPCAACPAACADESIADFN